MTVVDLAEVRDARGPSRQDMDPYRSLFGLSDRAGYRPGPSLPSVQFSITAAAEDAGGFHGVAIVEGVRTTDHREIGTGALETRDLPLPWMFLPETTWGHEQAKLAGRIDRLFREGNAWQMEGTYDLGEAGQECRRMVDAGMMRWCSADLEVIESTFIEIGVDLPLFDDDEWWSQLGLDAGYDWWERITKGRIMGVTATPHPAFPQAVIAPAGQPLPETSPDNGLPTLTASAEYVDGLPPAEWFSDPGLDRPTKFRVEDSGRFYGHLADWNTDHIGLPAGQKPPRSASGYAYFRMGTTTAMGPDGPTDVPTGPISMGGGHADEHLGYLAAVEHYDSTSSAIADVACGEDEHGIWVAGAMRPETSAVQRRAARAARGLSGDWRWIAGGYELVAGLVVNVPGFPIPSLAASGADSIVLPTELPRMGVVNGRPVSLVAAGVVREDPVGAALRALACKIEQHELIIKELSPMAAERLVARARGGK